MRYRLEKLGCYILIIILLPYIITVFLNGNVISSGGRTNEISVKVQIVGDEENQVALTDYGIGILAKEISPEFELEAIKAQAIMVRTKIYKCLYEDGSGALFTEEFWTRSDMEEAWGVTAYAEYYKKLNKAWEDTKGQVLMYEEKLIHTPFFSLSNGATRDGTEVFGEEYPYLKIKDCPLDIEAAEQMQTITIDIKDAKETEDIEVLSCDSAGYVLKVRVGKEVVSGEEFRKNYKLASSCFSVHEYEGDLRITTRGVGHGVGLSQYTANKMAENGKCAEEILAYFYEGCELKEIADVVVTEEAKTNE